MTGSSFDNHMNEPRNVAFSKENSPLYQGTDEESLLKAKTSIFRKGAQKDLFLMAFALGIFYEEKKPISNKVNNVSVNAMTEKQKWAILAAQILATKDIECLADESEIYHIAEEYANAGIKILKSKMDEAGDNYPNELAIELKRILGALD